LAFDEVLDEEDANILQYVPIAVSFIVKALKSEGSKVLVHCEAGRSRSAAIIVAYLMQVEHKYFEDAIMTLTAINCNICPNMGFCDQLRLYEDMGCRINERHPGYRQFFAEQLAQMRVDDGYVEEASLADVDNTGSSETQTQIRCRKCRFVIGTEVNVLQHESGTGQTSFKFRKRDASSGENVKCSSLFIEPMKWMLQSGVVDGYHVEGKLLCGQCEARLGAFNWSGQQCSCGAWVTPSFQIHNGKVDVLKPLQQPKLTTPVLVARPPSQQ